MKKSQFVGASGLHYLHGESGANNLRNRNGERDYLLGTGSLQWGLPIRGIPLTVGADIFYNFLDYGNSSHINVLARLYLVEAITTAQDGNRFRLDLNWRF